MRKDKLNFRSFSKRALVSTSLVMLLANSAWAVSLEQPNMSNGSAEITQQQKKVITGVVTDNNGETIIGANVSVKGTKTGIVTDLNGAFSLSIPSNCTITVSYIGYLPQDIKITNQTSLTIKLAENNNTLDEVVVVGYGTQKKVNLTGSVASVDFTKQAQSRPVTNVSTALAGLSSGVQVMQGSGQPGSDGATIRIRGVGTMNSANPLVIIDGMEGILDSVNPQDIDNISVLKDAASCAIYGSRAANGVILVTTKRGTKDNISVSYSGRLSYAQPTNLVNTVSNYADYMEWINESATNIGQKSNFNQSTIDLWREKANDPNGLNDKGVPNYVAFPNTNWQDAIFQHGLINDHNISVSGGSDKVRFLSSLGYLDNPGLVENTGINRYSIRTNLEANVTKWLTLGNRTYASEENKDPGSFDNANNYLRQTTPGLYPRWNGNYGWPEAPEESATANNIFAFLNGSDGVNKKTRINTTFFSKVNFTKGLSWDVNLNYMRRWDEGRSWTNASDKVRFSDGAIMSTATQPSQMSTSFSNFSNRSYTFENLLHYNTTIAKSHDIGALLGYQEYYYYEYSTSGTKKGLIDQSINLPGQATEMISINGLATDLATRSYFGRINYAYKSRYLFEANVRKDGCSRYHTDHRWGVFPSLSGAWRISEEDFMKNTRSWLDNLKISGSWGKLGNTGGDNVGNYEYQSTYSLSNYALGNLQAPGLAIPAIANPLLSWESTRVKNLALDAILFRSRLSVTLEVYDKMTSDILYRPNIYLTMGDKTPPRLNIAELKNRGIELTLGWTDKIGKVGYSVSGNFAYNNNKVTKFKGEYRCGWKIDPTTGQQALDKNGKPIWESNIGDVSTGASARITEGKMMNEHYLKSPYKGDASYFNTDGSVNINGGPRDGMIRTEQDMAWAKAMIAAGKTFMPNKEIGKNKIWYGDYLYADANGDGIYGGSDDNEFQKTSSQPKYNFGMQFSANWNGFDISMNWAGQAGFKLYWGATTGYNSTGTRVGLGLGTEVANNHYFYNPENPSDPRTNINAKYPRLTLGESGSQNTESSTLFLYKGDYIKLKNLTIGYTLPKKIAAKILTKSVRFYLSGENLLNINSFPGQDPELGAAPEYTSLRTFAFGTNITF